MTDRYPAPNPEKVAWAKQINANPRERTTQLAFADWLDERDDPRAEGYRALGLRGFVTGLSPAGGRTRGWADASYGPPFRSSLPNVWFWEVRTSAPYRTSAWVHWPTRREAEDAAALAFARLPAEVRAELLAPAGAAK